MESKMLKRVATVGTVAAGTVLVGVAPAFATTAPTPPDASATVTDAAGQLSNGVIDTFVEVLPYAIPVLLAFWGYGAVKGMIGARKKKPG